MIERIAELEYLLNERTKELRCLYAVSEIIDRNASIEETCRNLMAAMVTAWQFSESTCVRIVIDAIEYTTNNFVETAWRQSAPVLASGVRCGTVDVCYLEEKPDAYEGPFFREERELLNAIAERIGKTIEHKRAEEELRQTKEYLENLLNYANAPIIVWDGDYRISIFNRAFERLTGLNYRNVIGERIELLFPQESLLQTMDFIAQATTGEHWESVDIPIQCTNGSIRTVLWNSASIRDPRSGASIATIAQGQDITERKQAEVLLQESERKFAAAFRVSPVLKAITTVEEGRFIEVNDAFLDALGYTADEVIGTTSTALNLWISDRDTMLGSFNDSGDLRNFDVQMRTRSGSTLIGIFSGKLITVDNRRCLLSVMTDITARKQAEVALREQEAQLLQADKMASLGRIVSGVAHEINNPNNFIMLNAPLLHKAWECVMPILKSRDDGMAHGYIGKMRLDEFTEYMFPLIDGILDGSRRIARIVTDLKDYARPDACDVNGSIDFAHVITSAISLMRNTLTKKTIDVTWAGDRAPVTIQGSFQRLEQVVINLLQNSCDAFTSDEDRRITILLDDTSTESIVLCISDSGGGIAPDDLPHVTEPFFTTKRSSGGTGLGLSVSSKIIADHGGKISFTSERNNGTAVTVSLPRKRG